MAGGAADDSCLYVFETVSTSTTNKGEADTFLIEHKLYGCLYVFKHRHELKRGSLLFSAYLLISVASFLLKGDLDKGMFLTMNE